MTTDLVDAAVDADPGVFFDGDHFWFTVENFPPWPHRQEHELAYPRIWFVTFDNGTTVAIPGALTRYDAVRNASNHVGKPAGARGWIGDAVVGFEDCHDVMHLPASLVEAKCGRDIRVCWVWLPRPAVLPGLACQDCFSNRPVVGVG